MTHALLFDLDDTLVVEEQAAVAAFEATARFAASRHVVDVAALAAAARANARVLWHATPAIAYCEGIGISSWEGLWCRFDGDEPSMAWLRRWSPNYRREAWRLALAEQGVDDDGLAEELGERFGIERRALCEVFDDADPVLRALGDQYALAQLGCDAAEAVMIGDSLRRDIEGARAAGLGAVWLNRSGANGGAEVRQIATLSDLPAVL